MKAPAIHYAYAPDGAALAYQVFGEGPIDVLFVLQSLSSIELFWEHPQGARFFDRLGRFARVITFDRRGSGLSSRWGAPLSLEEQVDDVKAVLDTVGCERAHLFAMLEGGAMAMLFAGTAPDRVASLTMYASFARNTWAEDYPWAHTKEQRSAQGEMFIATWGKGFGLDVWAPSYASDAYMRDWIARLQSRAMAPDEWRRAYSTSFDLDVRPILGSIHVPTLVLHRTDDRAIDVRHSRYLAENLPNARYAEFPGRDNVIFLGDADAILGEVEEFLTGARQAPEPDRILATVLFTDICSSTERAAKLGDRRWREVLTAHHESVRLRVSQYGGREIKTIGDGVLATFDGPARGVRAARGIVDDSAAQGLEVRAGLHTGEVEVIGADVGGMAVHIGARVSSEAAAGEVLVSGTVKDLVVGSGLDFEPRGSRALKGVPGEWALWAVRG
jgi:class 3 adenylate cyclase